MPLRDFTCQTCGTAQERFYHAPRTHFRANATAEWSETDQPVYPLCACGGTLEPQELSASFAKTGVFPFEGRHITPDGKPITIESIGHLRQIERQYGVVLTAFSNDPSRGVDGIKDLPRYRGHERER